ncbi:DAZ-associated protein 2 isoform X1 [Coccinella septempunctata]|uniref:DAZ-associated protein 2 isoform X1 n=1 Tax=Coccinella septempunctata TaxID=41139 RepID=UPI001D06CB6D|nr:DAZ-associated protein 2 isoform X1 [Coccinella septempunctata]
MKNVYHIMVYATNLIAIGGAVPPPPQAQAYTPQPPPQANPGVQAPQPYGVLPGIPTSSPYVIPGQTQLYPQGPPPTYDQALTHPALVGQHIYPPGTMYAAGYPTYLGYPAYTPMQYYPSLGAYSYAMQPTAQLRPTIMIPNGYDAGARFDGIAQQVIPPAPPGVPPSAAQLAAMAGHQVALGQKKNTFLTGGSDGGYTFW